MSGIVSLNSHNNLLQIIAFISELLKDLQTNKKSAENIKLTLVSIFTNNNPGFCAAILHILKPADRIKVVELLDTLLNPEILNYLDETIQKEICNTLANYKLAEMLSRLKESEASEILENLSPEQLKSLLPSFNHFFRKSIEKVLNYPEDTAGKIMDYNIVSVPEDWTISQIKNFIKTAKNLPKTLNTIFLINKSGSPTGQIALSSLMRLEKNSNLENKIEKIECIFSFLAPTHEIIYAFKQYNLYCAPVIDENQALVGMIDVSTILSLAQEQAEENFMYAAGIESSDFHENLLSTSYNRLQWLFVSACVAMFISCLMDRCVQPQLLAILTMITSICGSSGVQVVTIIINALDNKELFELNIKSTIIKELSVAFLNALCFCILISLYLKYIQHYHIIVILMFNSALIFSMIASSLVGILLPFILFKLNIDPAIGSGAMLNAITDTISVITFILIFKALSSFLPKILYLYMQVH